MPERLKRNLKLHKLTFSQKRDDSGRSVGNFSGYLSVWNVKDSYGTSFLRGSFLKSLGEHDTFPLLADHFDFRPIGKFGAKEDDYGLRIDAEMYLDIEEANNKWILLTNKAINGLSVGFDPVKETYNSDTGVTEFNEVRLYEGSVVTFPSNEMALVDQLRSLAADDRKILAPAYEAADKLIRSLRISRQAIAGEKTAADSTVNSLTDAIDTFTALRARLQRIEAAPSDPEPRQHSAEDSTTSATEKIQLEELDKQMQRALEKLKLAAA